MTFELRVRAQAERDIRDARDWYELQAEGLGGDLDVSWIRFWSESRVSR